MSEPLKCFVIGADSLLAECGDILLARGHEICGVATRAARIESWARGHGIDIVDLDGDYVAAMAAKSFDWLFAITHLEILPADVLAIPTCGAINFHDGPLPRYAGLNTPAWALIAGEVEYGVTWHAITSGVDEGDILVQRTFEVADGETSLSLNTRCFAEGIDAFVELVDRMQSDALEPVAQDKLQRSVFKRADRPPSCCAIDWRWSATRIERLVRALDFGEYANPLGIAKARLDGVSYAVTVVTAIDGAAAPGACVVTDDGLVVGAGEGRLLIRSLSDLDGIAIELATLGGRQFDVFDQPTLDAWTDVGKRAAKAEPRWLKDLLAPAAVAPAHLPPHASGRQRSTRAVAAFEGRSESERLGLFASYVARTTGRSAVRLSRPIDKATGGATACPWLADTAPVLIDVDLDAPWRHAAGTVAAAIDAHTKRGPILADLHRRTPSIRGVLASIAVLGDQLSYDPEVVTSEQVASVIRDIGRIAADESTPVARVDLLGADRARLIDAFNATERVIDGLPTVHERILAQAAIDDTRDALIFEGRTLTYAALVDRTATLAADLVERGVGPGRLVGVFVERSIDLVVAVVAVLRAGAAYVPLDPDYPAERLEFMIEDANLDVIVDHAATRSRRLPASIDRVAVDALRSNRAELPNVASDDLAYVIYTSGSTGRPKGVEVEHRNVVNFCCGMSDRLDADPPGVWLAVTSLSFDISVLELLWTLTAGFSVVIYADRDRATLLAPTKMDYGLFMWGNDDAPGRKKYQLMLDGARFFDTHGFQSVWTPERHFHAFGGPYPNPAVTGAALAAITDNLAIRAGSCVSPLHHPLRIAEEWAVVDNLCDGRVGVAFAAGWQPNDFVLRPEAHANNKRIMFEQIDIIRRLWRGESVEFDNPFGDAVATPTLPRPVQDDLPVWVTSAGNPDTYRMAGEIGANVLTHLLGQSIDEVAAKIAIYREARALAGYDPGYVTLMLHTFVGDDADTVKAIVREPMKAYLRASVGLVKQFAWTFPAFKRPVGETASPADVDLDALSEEDLDAILEFAFERYFEDSGLFGTPEGLLARVHRLESIGVDEIACLLDFGVPTAEVLDSLPRLADLRARSNATRVDDGEDWSFAAQVRRFGVTHLQCTPSMARMFLAQPQARAALSEIRHLMIGGEALASDLAGELRAVTAASITNMYGPTETTIWSSTHDVRSATKVCLGRPIANTRLYILDDRREPAPVGVPAELYIGGAGVVRGYRGRPELTAERFVEDPIAGGRMYRTGDQVRWLPDGSIEFLGRLDHQVKIRGYRIELGEIEARVRDVAGVRDAAVIATDVDDADRRLVAYVVGGVSQENLRSHLQACLPASMVPAHFVFLDALPLTPNKKLDRGALPDVRRTTTVSTEVAPETDLEATVASIWRETLGTDRVGVEDNFFDIGGHSLLIVRMHAKLKAAVDQPISVTDLYRFPTIRALARHVATGEQLVTLDESSERAQRRRASLSRRRGRGPRP